MTEWISVKDRLPETCDYVLVCVKFIYGRFVGIGWHGVYTGKWHCEIFGEIQEDTKAIITSWMPMPELPEEE